MILEKKGVSSRGLVYLSIRNYMLTYSKMKTGYDEFHDYIEFYGTGLMMGRHMRGKIRLEMDNKLRMLVLTHEAHVLTHETKKGIHKKIKIYFLPGENLQIDTDTFRENAGIVDARDPYYKLRNPLSGGGLLIRLHGLRSFVQSIENFRKHTKDFIERAKLMGFQREDTEVYRVDREILLDPDYPHYMHYDTMGAMALLFGGETTVQFFDKDKRFSISGYTPTETTGIYEKDTPSWVNNMFISLPIWDSMALHYGQYFGSDKYREEFFFDTGSFQFNSSVRVNGYYGNIWAEGKKVLSKPGDGKEYLVVGDVDYISALAEEAKGKLRPFYTKSFTFNDEGIHAVTKPIHMMKISRQKGTVVILGNGVIAYNDKENKKKYLFSPQTHKIVYYHPGESIRFRNIDINDRLEIVPVSAHAGSTALFFAEGDIKLLRDMILSDDPVSVYESHQMMKSPQTQEQNKDKEESAEDKEVEM